MRCNFCQTILPCRTTRAAMCHVPGPAMGLPPAGMSWTVELRRRGFATNDEGTKEGIDAVGVGLRDGSGTTVAGLSVAVPRQRYRQALDGGLVAQVARARTAIEAGLADFTAHL